MKHQLGQVNIRMLEVRTEQLTFDGEAYKAYFDVVAQTKDGLLLVVK